MKTLEGKLALVRKRLVFLELAGIGIKLIFMLAVGLAIFILADKLIHFGKLLSSGVLAAMAAGLCYYAVRSFQNIDAAVAARKADQQFNLHERLSSAIALAGATEPMAPALETDAERHAAKVDPYQFKFRPPKQLKLLPAPMFAIVGLLLFMPSVDLLGRQAAAIKTHQEQQEVKKQGKHIELKAMELEKKLKQADNDELRKLAKKMEKLGKDLQKSPTTKKDALVKLSKLEDEVRKQQEKMKRAEKFSDMNLDTEKLNEEIAKLEKAREEAKKLTDALKKGEFDKAAEALKDIAEKLKNGEISPDEAKKLANVIKQAAQGMPKNDQLTKTLNQLAQQMQTNATVPANMQNQLKQLKLTQQQLQQLQQQMNQAQACKMANNVLNYNQQCLSCNKSAKICPACGNPICAGCGTFDCVCCPNSINPKTGGPCCAGLQCAKNSASMTLAQSKSGGAGQGAGGQAGNGKNGGGKGRGTRDIAPKGNVNFQNTKVLPKLGPGDILATQFMNGMPPEGDEAKAEYKNVLESANKLAEDAIRNDEIPPQQKEKIKQYFDGLNNR